MDTFSQRPHRGYTWLEEPVLLSAEAHQDSGGEIRREKWPVGVIFSSRCPWPLGVHAHPDPQMPQPPQLTPTTNCGSSPVWRARAARGLCTSSAATSWSRWGIASPYSTCGVEAPPILRGPPSAGGHLPAVARVVPAVAPLPPGLVVARPPSMVKSAEAVAEAARLGELRALAADFAGLEGVVQAFAPSLRATAI